LLDVVVADQAVRVVELERHFYRGVKDRDARIFDDITVRRDFLDFLYDFGLGLVRKEDYRYFAFGQDLFRGFRTVSTVAEVDVHEHQIDGPVVPEQVERLVAGIRDFDAVAVFFERHFLGQRYDYFILDQEKFFLCPITHASRSPVSIISRTPE